MNKHINSFNIRVYGLILESGSILLSKELIMGEEVIKFPGGGLEHGEGLIEGLNREFKEELGQRIYNVKHYYTTDFFQRSSFKLTDQLISIYYTGKLKHKVVNKINKPKKEQPVFIWEKLERLNEVKFKFPIDQLIIKKLKS
ncbi:MAG: NUDIX hydrolase [Crocinitomicaceae bacterium]|nr:NUDIX hydrolase [Crocinitomicaceae bacterium]|tara:strand:+ start:2661 stop:3086 length:426 start_codon:yes stop_codon:yes gene_type:complete